MLLVEQLVGRELRGEVTVGGQELGTVCLGLFFCVHCAGKTTGREAFCDRKAPAVPHARPVERVWGSPAASPNSLGPLTTSPPCSLP